MSIHKFLMAAALLAVTGWSVSATAAEQKPVEAKPAWNSLRDGAPPPLASSQDRDVAASGVSQSEAARMATEQNDPAESARRAARSDDQILDERSEKQVEWMRSHNKSVYGSEDGPYAALEKQQQAAIAAKKKVDVYGMTYAEREAMLKAEAAQAAKDGVKPAENTDAAKESKPAGAYIYNRKKSGDAPPRLFNNVTR